MSCVKNIVVADSSSIKTEWLLLDAVGKYHNLECANINSFLHGEKDIERILQQIQVPERLLIDIQELHFFGMGCYCPDRREQIANALNRKFPNAFVSIESDILGVAYASLGQNKGLIALMDMSSNMAYYDGRTIQGCNSSIGHILGEEVSWVQMGKQLLTDFIYGKIPNEIGTLFSEEFNPSKETIIKNIYKRPDPTHYIASFSSFIITHQAHSYFQDMITTILRRYIPMMLKQYVLLSADDKQCVFVGSLATSFSSCVHQVASENGIIVRDITNRNLEALMRYVSENNLVEL